MESTWDYDGPNNYLKIQKCETFKGEHPTIKCMKMEETSKDIKSNRQVGSKYG